METSHKKNKKTFESRWIVSLWLRRLFSVESHIVQIDAATVSETIAKMEQQTLAEIRVHASTKKLQKPIMAVAVDKFNELEMFKTKHRNGILIYVNTKEKQFAILGDEGINNKVNPDFWLGIQQEMGKLFQKKNHTAAVVYGIEAVGQILAKEFPATAHNAAAETFETAKDADNSGISSNSEAIDENPNELSNELTTD